MSLTVLVITAASFGVLTGAAARLYGRRSTRREPPSQAVAEETGRVLGRFTGLPGRLAPRAATSLALTIALVAVAVFGVALAALAFLVRGRTPLGIDSSAEAWADRHASATSTDVLELLTHLGDPPVVVALAAVLGAVETYRTRSRWVLPFLAVVVAGNGFLTTTIKELADRVRPALNPVAETLGPSFPSGHSSWSAAFWAAAALLLTRQRPPKWRPVIIGACAAMAAAVGATRVLLGVHWVTDVAAGLALGWMWFAGCAVAFGGRRLRFGLGGEAVASGTREPLTQGR